MLPLHSPRIGSRLPSGVIRARLLSVATGLACFALATATAAQQPASNSAQASTPSLSSKIGAQVKDLKKIDVKQGDGKEAVTGKIVVVHYTGWLYDPAAADGHGAKFDSSVGKTPFEFPLGGHRVIQGWDEGVAGMKVGGKRTLVIPSQMAYGERGSRARFRQTRRCCSTSSSSKSKADVGAQRREKQSPAAGLPSARVSCARARAHRRARSRGDARHLRLCVPPEPGGAAGACARAARPRRRGPARGRRPARRRRAAAGALEQRRAVADPPRPAGQRAPHRQRDGQSRGQRRTRRPLRVDRGVLHAMRGGRVPSHRLFFRPPRRPRHLYGHDRRRSRSLPGAPVERQSLRCGTARPRPPFRALARSVSQADVSLRAGRRRPRSARGPVHDDGRPRRRAGDLVDAAQPAALRACDGFAQARDALGRGALRPRVRPRPVHDLLRRRLQHGRDGEQGPQHLQQQARARRPGHGDRRRLPGDRGGRRPRIFPQLDRQSRDLPRLVPAVAEGRAHGVSRPGVLGRHGLPRGRAHRRRRLSAERAVPGGRRADGAPGAPGRVPRDQQFLHRDGVRERRRGDPDAAHAAGAVALPARNGSLFRAARRAGRDLRRFRAGDGRCERGVRRTGLEAVPPLVQPGRHADRQGCRSLRRGGRLLHARRFAAHAGHAGPGPEAAVSHSARSRPRGSGRRRHAGTSGRRDCGEHRNARALRHGRTATVHLPRCRRQAGAVAIARILRSGAPRVRLHGSGARAPRRARQRRRQPVGRRAAELHPFDSRSRRGARAQRAHGAAGIARAPRRHDHRRPRRRSRAARARADAAGAGLSREPRRDDPRRRARRRPRIRRARDRVAAPAPRSSRRTRCIAPRHLMRRRRRRSVRECCATRACAIWCRSTTRRRAPSPLPSSTPPTT